MNEVTLTPVAWAEYSKITGQVHNIVATYREPKPLENLIMLPLFALQEVPVATKTKLEQLKLDGLDMTGFIESEHVDAFVDSVIVVADLLAEKGESVSEEKRLRSAIAKIESLKRV